MHFATLIAVIPTFVETCPYICVLGGIPAAFVPLFIDLVPASARCFRQLPVRGSEIPGSGLAQTRSTGAGWHGRQPTGRSQSAVPGDPKGQGDQMLSAGWFRSARRREV